MTYKYLSYRNCQELEKGINLLVEQGWEVDGDVAISSTSEFYSGKVNIQTIHVQRLRKKRTHVK